MNKNISKPAVFIFLNAKTKEAVKLAANLYTLKPSLAHLGLWSRSSVSFHCFVAEFINSIILRVIIGFYPKKYAIIYYKCEPRTVKRYLSITAINNSNIIWLK